MTIYWHITKDDVGKVWYGGDPQNNSPDLEIDVSEKDKSWTNRMRGENTTEDMPTSIKNGIRDDLLSTYDGSRPPTQEGMTILADFLAGNVKRFLPDSYQEGEETSI